MNAEYNSEATYQGDQAFQDQFYYNHQVAYHPQQIFYPGQSPQFMSQNFSMATASFPPQPLMYQAMSGPPIYGGEQGYENDPHMSLPRGRGRGSRSYRGQRNQRPDWSNNQTQPGPSKYYTNERQSDYTNPSDNLETDGIHVFHQRGRDWRGGAGRGRGGGGARPKDRYNWENKRGGQYNASRANPYNPSSDSSYHNSDSYQGNYSHLAADGGRGRGADNRKTRGRGYNQENDRYTDSRDNRRSNKKSTNFNNNERRGKNEREIGGETDSPKSERKQDATQSNSRNVSDMRDANKKYESSRGRGKSFQIRRGHPGEDDETQRGTLIEQLSNNSYECMVCCDIVKREAAIWPCGNCYHVFHLRCIKKWATSSTAKVEAAAVNGWRCPACQNVNHKMPNQYRCFCGKVRDPEFTRYDTPHSCGEVCRRKRTADCPHSCNILCHPGPCPPCQATITKHCDCGKTKQTVKCGQSSSLKCSESCQKQLNCGKHDCQQVCHPGPCQPCDVVIIQNCYCESSSRDVICGSCDSFQSHYSCQSKCGRMLECGQHECVAICHPGLCEPCKLLPAAVDTCHCGKTSLSQLLGLLYQREACTDPIPVCDLICDKPLRCGSPDKPHRCRQTCHEGDCGPCEGDSQLVCRCGGFTKEMSCQEAAQFTEETPYKCERRCNKKKQCGRHRCGQHCCVESEHLCTQLCGQKLTCGLHRCEEPCHRGNCPKCWQVSFDELHCHCGAEVLFPPIQCGTKPPECFNVCTRQHTCNHQVRHNCHSDERCPPCTELTEKWCMGKHEKRKNLPCHLTDISCGLHCNRDLPCGLHKCQTKCHKGECVQEVGKCSQPCPRIREECGHPCNAPCHGTEPCPKTSCPAKISINCKCGNRSETVLCLAGGEEKTEDYQRMATMMMAMKMADVQSGQSIDITGLTSDGSKKKTRELECNSDCAMKERNRRLALALEIKNPDVRSKLQLPPYTDFLKSYAKQNLSFVAGIEKLLSELVHNAQKSKQAKRSTAFPPMTRDQRRTIHELAEFYGCETQSYDQEPKKNVVATAYKDKCWHPKVSLTALVQRELHPKAPMPIPIGSKEQDMRVSMQAARQSTSVMGTSSWSSVAMATAPAVTPASSWASKLRVSSSNTTLRKEEPTIDYFDMTE